MAWLASTAPSTSISPVGVPPVAERAQHLDQRVEITTRAIEQLGADLEGPAARAPAGTRTHAIQDVRSDRALPEQHEADPAQPLGVEARWLGESDRVLQRGQRAHVPRRESARQR